MAVLLVFGLLYPTHFLIADELAYFQQAVQWSGQQAASEMLRSCVGAAVAPAADYPPGAGLLGALAILLAGPSAVFCVGITLWLLGCWATGALLISENRHPVWAIYPVLFLPGLLLTRCFMGDLAGFAASAVFLWHFQRGRFLGAGLAAGLALLFRETNLLWSLPFLASASWQRMAGWPRLWVGLAVGLAARLAASAVFFGHPFFVRDPGIGFGWAALPGNLLFYSLMLLVAYPGGLWLWWRSQHPLRREMAWAMVCLVLFYSFYEYAAWEKSGYKALVLLGRYMLPLAPFFALSAASVAGSFIKKVGVALPVLAGGGFLGVQLLGWAYNGEQEKFTRALLAMPDPVHLSFSPDESRKYLNPLHLGPQLVDARGLTAGALQCRDRWQVHFITRSESADWRKKSDAARSQFFEKFKTWEKNQLVDQRLADGARLEAWVVRKIKRDAAEQ